MQLKNTIQTYGLIAIVLHWVTALTVFGLFGLGLYMVGLSYYDPWYHGSLDLHKSIGVSLFALFLLRAVWRFINHQPNPEPGKAFEHLAAKATHGLLYLVPLLLMLSGYLISTADGHAISVFNTLSLPALPSLMENQEEFFGEVHEVLAWGVMGLAALHAAAALKHHFINRDRTLMRMLKVTKP